MRQKEVTELIRGNEFYGLVVPEKNGEYDLECLNMILRKNEYPDIGEQLDMIFKDMKNGSQEWINHIDSIKAKYPKS